MSNLSRRDALKLSLLTGAMPFVRHGDLPQLRTDRLRLGIIGVGNRGAAAPRLPTPMMPKRNRSVRSWGRSPWRTKGMAPVSSESLRASRRERLDIELSLPLFVHD